MIYFSFFEIINSVIMAVAYGLFFPFIPSLLLLVEAFTSSCFDILRSIGQGKKNRYKFKLKKEHPKKTFVVLNIVLFFLGFILLSYIALDGVIRIYLLIIVFASFYLSKIHIFCYFEKLLEAFVTFIIHVFSAFFEVISYPPRKVFSILRKIIKKRDLLSPKIKK